MKVVHHIKINNILQIVFFVFAHSSDSSDHCTVNGTNTPKTIHSAKVPDFRICSWDYKINKRLCKTA